MKDYKKVVDYIEFLKKTYNLMITIKDYKGFVYENEDMEFALRAYLAHTNPYCMFVKETEMGFSKCLNNNKLLINECKKKDYFFHVCHAGICELIIPIKDEEKVYGSINISHFNLYPEKSKKALEETFSEDRKVEGLRKYKIFAKSTFVDSSTLIPSLELLSQYILLLIKSKPNKQTENKLNLEDKFKNYILLNISNKILAEDIIRDLYITRDQLTQLIKQMGMKNLRDCINTLRIEQGEKLLLETKKSPVDISSMLGFKGYKYFENLFKEKLNISPEDYRKYYINEKYY
ncbi:MAG: helix-turn-helix domain-containing protein [Pleomorphochaeta sp.]